MPTTKKKAMKTLTAAQKKRMRKQIETAEQGLKTLTATVKSLRASALANAFFGGQKLGGRARRRRS